MNIACDICFNNYDLNQHKPVIVMQCGHTYCDRCCAYLKIHDYRCPKDREPITNQKPNYALLDLLNSDISRVENSIVKRENVFKMDALTLEDIGENYYKKGIAFFEASNFNLAIENFDKAIQSNYNLEKSHLKKARSFLNLDKFYDAIVFYDKSIDLNNNCIEAYIYKGVCLEEIGETSKSVELYEKANILLNNPIDADELMFKGICLRLLRKEREAIVFLDRSIDLKPSPALFTAKGSCLWSLNNHTEALECYNNAINLNQKYYVAYFAKGSLFISLNRYSEAIDAINIAIELNPLPEIYKKKAEAYSKLNKFDEAVECYISAISLDPSDSESRKLLNEILEMNQF